MLVLNFQNTEENRELFEALNLQPDVDYTIEEIEQHLLNVLVSGDRERCDRARKAWSDVQQRASKWFSNAYERSVRPLIAEHGRDFTFSLDDAGSVSALDVHAYRQNSPTPLKRTTHKKTVRKVILLILWLASAIIFFRGIVPTLGKIIHSSPQPSIQEKS